MTVVCSKRGLRFMVVAVIVGAAQSAYAGPFDVDYNTPGDLTGKFNLNVNNAAIKYTQVASGGLGNSGAVDLLNTTEADHTTAVFNQAGLDFATPGARLDLSQFVLRKDAFITSTPFYQMGLVSDLNERLDGGSAANSYASVRIMPSTTTTPTDVFLQVETKLSGGGRVRVTPGQTGTLTAGHWYRVASSFENTSATQVTVSMALEDWGVTGAALQATVFSLAPTLVNLAGADQINGDGLVYAGYRAFDEGGTDLLDNFSVVPEPATLLGAAALVLMCVRRR